MKSLGDFVENVAQEQEEIVEIDLSEYLEEPAGTTVFTYKHPTAAQLFQAGKTGKRLSVEYLEMTDEMGATCATMGLAHVSPPAEKPARLYAKLALKNGKLFTWLMNRFLKAYPDLANLEAKIDEAKKQLLMGM